MHHNLRWTHFIKRTFSIDRYLCVKAVESGAFNKEKRRPSDYCENFAKFRMVWAGLEIVEQLSSLLQIS